MYEYLKGTVVELNPAQIVLDISGVGYSVMISLRSYEEFSQKEIVLVYVHQYAIRDELPMMYGFSTKDEREIFRLLISVSGVGGNTARTILSTFNSLELQHIISNSNVVMLKKVKGLGQKTAEKVIVELRDKIVKVDVHSSQDAGSVVGMSSAVYEEAVSALTMLGFKKDKSIKCVRAIINDEPGLNVEEVIKLSLKNM